MKFINIKLVCPHCAFVSTVKLDISDVSLSSPQIWYCDCEKGGCNKPFSTLPKVEIKAEFKTFKIGD